MTLYNQADSRHTARISNQHARWAEARVTPEHWQSINRPSWPWMLAMAGIVGLVMWSAFA